MPRGRTLGDSSLILPCRTWDTRPSTTVCLCRCIGSCLVLCHLPQDYHCRWLHTCCLCLWRNQGPAKECVCQRPAVYSTSRTWNSLGPRQNVLGGRNSAGFAKPPTH